MAYHLWDGFDDYDAAHELWPVVNGTIDYSSAYARFPAPAGCVGQGIRFHAGGATWKQWNMASNQATMIFCFGLLLPSLGGAGNNRIMQFSDAAVAQCSFTTTSSGQLGMIQGFNGSLIASSAVGALTAGVQHWIAMLVTINNAAGVFQLFVDGVQAINASALNNRGTANNFMNQFLIGDFGNTFNGMQIDDFHAHDITGSKPNAILSDSRIYTKLPTGQGFSTQFTPSGAGANWQCVDEQIPDDDVTYVSSAGGGQIDGYVTPVAGFTTAPNGLVRRSRVRRDDAGPHTFQNGIRSNGVNSLGTAFTVPSSYAYTDTCFVNDPATGVQFTAVAADQASPIIEATT